MHIGVAFGVFIVPYIIQLLLCFKAKNKHIKLIPFYLCMLGAMYSGMVYTEFFGLYDDGSWMSLKAVVYFICLLIIISALFLAMITHRILTAFNTKNK